MGLRSFARRDVPAAEKRRISERKRMERLAGQIRDEAQLERILRGVAPGLRDAVRQELAPHLRFAQETK